MPKSKPNKFVYTTSVFTIIVTPAGFEPATNRAEICHSIQLNYGAKMTTKVLIF